MKRTMKKHVALLLAVLMLLTSVGMNVVAASEHQCYTNQNNPEYYNVVNPTCEAQGYTEYLCVICKEVVSTGDYSKPLGHKLGDYVYEKVEGGYNKYRKCIREYTANGVVAGGCEFTSYEMEDGAKTLYHKVIFVNNKVTAAYDETITYTNIAKEFKSQELHSYYAKHGEEVRFEGKIAPHREKTVDYSIFECIGWSTKDNLEATVEKNLTPEDCDDLTTITADLKTADLVLYPVFVGFKSIYDVVFYNAEGQNITWRQDVNHGEFPKYSDPNGDLYPSPTKTEDIVNYYQFNGWSTKFNQTEGVPTEEIESTPVYDNIHYRPAFKPVAKNYAIELYDEAGENLLKINGEDAVFEGLHLEENFFQHSDDVYKEVLDYCMTERSKDSDKEYYYIWAGWQVLRADNTLGTRIVTMDKYGNMTFNGLSNIIASDIINVVDEEGNTVYLEDVVLADGLTEGNKEPRKVIRIVPIFERKLQSYAVDIDMQLPTSEDADYFRGDAVVHVVDRNGQLVASGKTNADGKFRCRLNYNTPFTVTVATYDSKYIGTATINELLRSSDIEDVEAEINKCRVAMQLNPEYETHCGCIHHVAFLQPLFVSILNILYNFFNVKYVCCYDMYSTIGPLLDYTK